MAAPQNHWKLGLFVVCGLAVALAAVAVLGARSMRNEVVLYVSFFDESVQGLEVGSPIKFRGVTIGTVGKIQVASDRRHVEVQSELGVSELIRLGLNIRKGALQEDSPEELQMASDLRMQLASAGLTGVKFLQLDFFDATLYPRPELPFEVPENYIPTAPSMMKNLDDSLTRMMNTLPEITDQMSSILTEVDAIVREVNQRQFPQQIALLMSRADEIVASVQIQFEQLDAEGLIRDVRQAVTSVDEFLQTAEEKLAQVDLEELLAEGKEVMRSADALLATAQQKLEKVDAAGLSKALKQALAGVQGAVGQFDGLLAKVGKDDGLLASVDRATNAVSDTLRDADGLGAQLVEMLVSLEASARSIRKLTEALEADPDMLLKGRSPEEER